MNYTRIRVSEVGPVATVTLHRPEVHNAFDDVMISELTKCIRRLAAESEARAIVLTGAGSSFCAGGDLSWMKRVAAYTEEENLEDARLLHEMFSAVAEAPQVTLARVNGAALGGGAGLVAVCDIAIAVDSARIGFTEVRLGLAPAVISPWVIQKIGVGAARALFVSGERISAAEAYRIGLLQEVTDAAGLETAVSRRLESILKCGPGAIAAVKRLLRDIAAKTPAEAAELTTRCIAELRASPEGQEGIQAFLEKRAPSFSLPPQEE